MRYFLGQFLTSDSQPFILCFVAWARGNSRPKIFLFCSMEMDGVFARAAEDEAIDLSLPTNLLNAVYERILVGEAARQADAGKTRATMGISSLKERGLSLTTRSVMPPDSTWKTPSVLPLPSRS